MKDELLRTFETGLNKLRNEVEQYADDDALWIVPEGISNSAGTLCLHLLGNLNHYIGAKLGKTGYVRDRPSEFTTQNVSRSEILLRIDQTIEVIKETFSQLSESDLESWFPNDESDPSHTVAAELLSDVTHFYYHLGQINYHRRLKS